jgi:hypothetical protein
MGIFQKNCPECVATNPIDAISCGCGYCFDPEALARINPTAYADEQDRLYLDYLAARIAQAEAELVVAREQANADPESTYKASGALLAEQSLNALQAEMKQLSARLPPAPRARVVSVAKPAVRAPAKPVLAKAPVAKPVAPVTRMKVSTPNHAPRAQAVRTKPPSVSKAPAPMVAKPSQPKLLPAPPPVAARRTVAANPPPRKPQPAAAKLATPKALPKPISVTPVNRQWRPAVPATNIRPNENFRRLQSQKAEAIAQSKGAASSSPQPPVAVKAKPPTQRPPADIPPIALTPPDSTLECPNCTAKVAPNVTRCPCGYVLSSPGEKVPGITLDATALAILTEGVSVVSPNRRR